jgi:hypothetical protein
MVIAQKPVATMKQHYHVFLLMMDQIFLVCSSGLEINGFEVDAYDPSKEPLGEGFEPLISV